MPVGLVLAVSLQVSVPSYDSLLAEGMAMAREGQHDTAREVFDRAIAQDPTRPEAWVEGGGLAFLTRDYSGAVRYLRQALSLREDAYARDLLAASLFLSGRVDDALTQWNAVDRPALRVLSLNGLARTRGSVVRRELPFVEGTTLRLADLRESRLRLSEMGVFRRVTLRPVPLGEGMADLEVTLDERPPLGGGKAEVLTGVAVNLLYERLRLRYYNLSGAGITVGGQIRWEEHRPQWSASFSVPHALGTPLNLSLDALRGRQDYSLDGPLQCRMGGGGPRLRATLGARSGLEVGARVAIRTFSELRPYAISGRLVSLHAGLQVKIVDAWRSHLTAAARLAGASPSWGSEVTFARGEVRLHYRVQMSEPQDTTMEASVLATQLVAGWGSPGTPLDEMYAPGASPDMELPLRAHPQTQDGLLGVTPLGRSLLLANVEWRRRLFNGALFQVGVAAFVDAAQISARPEGPPSRLIDAGLGLRLAAKGGSVLRIDYGRSLNEDSRALYVGLNQAF